MRLITRRELSDTIVLVLRFQQVLLAKAESYRVASKVHDLTVKTRPRDVQKISLIRDLVAQNVDVKKILKKL